MNTQQIKTKAEQRAKFKADYDKLEKHFQRVRSIPSTCLNDPPLITFLPAGIDACSLWRMYIPHLNIPHSKFFLNDGSMPFAEVAASDVVVVQRLVDERNWRAIVGFRDRGIKVIYDLDDNLWDIPSYNPAFKAYKEAQKGIGNCAIEANIMTVSTEPLRQAVLKNVEYLFNLEIVVVPNGIDFRLFQSLPKHERDYVVVAYAGTNSHVGDVGKVFSLLPEMLASEEKMHLHMVGLPLPKEIEDNPRTRQVPWAPVSEYASRLASWRFDMLLAPLDDNTFNRSKSNIKMLEAAAMGIPILVSPSIAYREFCQLDKELDYLLCRTNGQWKVKIRELINEPAKRDFLAGRMRIVAEKYFSIEVTKNKWLEVARHIL